MRMYLIKCRTVKSRSTFPIAFGLRCHNWKYDWVSGSNALVSNVCIAADVSKWMSFRWQCSGAKSFTAFWPRVNWSDSQNTTKQGMVLDRIHPPSPASSSFYSRSNLRAARLRRNSSYGSSCYAGGGESEQCRTVWTVKRVCFQRKTHSVVSTEPKSGIYPKEG